VRITVCGLAVEVSVMASVALRTPAAVGVKTTLIAHFELVPILVPHVLVSLKSPGFAPTTEILVISTGEALDVLVIATICAPLLVPNASLPKFNVAGATVGPVVEPVPLKVTVCGLEGSESEMLTTALWPPTLDGVKVTLRVQLEPVGRLEPQVFV
jgi:hypothetical protein